MLTMIPHICQVCKKDFLRNSRDFASSKNKKIQNIFCSRQCFFNSIKKEETVKCKTCNVVFNKRKREIKKTKNNFCSKSCSASYYNKNKNYGIRRSKLEHFIEHKLKQKYPQLSVICNGTTEINAELDFYLPQLKLAFELNGIFHYEPIFGIEKLNKQKTNDKRKFQACLEKQIELCIIDTSSQKRFTEQSSKKFIDIIYQIINDKILLASPTGLKPVTTRLEGECSIQLS